MTIPLHFCAGGSTVSGVAYAMVTFNTSMQQMAVDEITTLA
ncbi:hypothetical protein [Kushneria aurantia]|uniref:Uncharacterized protein n=1 Tax=Kushneria aurantia TaxID=504092 RepID=A0ABV6G2A6_9GAMM|nr:hypothetical protein [Kushneria aurantia]